MSFASDHNIGAFIGAAKAIENTALTAAGGGDNTEVVGQIIDLYSYKHPLSAAVVVPFKAVLAANKKLTFKSVVLQHGDNSGLSDAATLESKADADVKVDGGAGGTYHDAKIYAFDLAGAKRYIRFKITPDLDATATDTATIAAAAIFGGQDQLS